MMNKLFLFVLGVMFACSAQAGDNDSIYILGWPCDAFTMEPVIDDTRVELMTRDSIVIATATPVWNTRYRPDSRFALKVGVRSGEFIVRLTNPRYQEVVKSFKLRVGKHEGSYSLGNLKMRREMKRELDEVTVSATKIKFYTRGDTLVYNADAFNLAEGSMLDALVEQLPGAELTRDGRIFVNGKLVESLLLNGKDFFKNDHTVLLDNLPAYTVQQIKVYDKLSDADEARSRQFGHTADEGRHVMDVILKREYQIGWLSNVELGGGTHDRWLARLFALRFTPQSRLTVYANANNTHENRKPGRGGEWEPGSTGNGISTTETGGIDYLIDDKNSRWHLEGNVSAAHSSTDIETRQSQEHFQSIGNTFTRRSQSAADRNTRLNTQHDFRFQLGPENNRNALTLNFRPRFDFSRSRTGSESLAAEFSANPFELDNWETLFHGPEADKALTSILVNKVQTLQRSNATNTSGGATAEMGWFIPHTPYNLTVTGGFNAGHEQSRRFDLYTLDYDGETDRRHRYFNQPSDHSDAHAGVSISTPFDLQWKWVATTGISYNYTHDRQDNALYRLDRLEEMADAGLEALPSTREALLSVLDRNNSYLTGNDRHQTMVRFDGRYDNNVYQNGSRYARFRFTWKTGLTLHTEQWDYSGLSLRNDRRTAWMPSLGLELLRNTPGMKHQLELWTEYRQQLPSMFSLMDLRFDSDPLNVREGNSGLRRTDVLSAKFHYNSDGWLSRRGQRLSAQANLHAYRNAVATAQTYSSATGVRTFRPENVNGNWDAQASANFYSRLGKKGFSMNVSLSESFYHSVDLTGTDAEVPLRSAVNTNYLSLPVKVDYSRKKVSLGAKAQVAWNHAESSRPNFQDINAADLCVGLTGNVTLPWDFRLATDLTCFTRCGYVYEAMNTTDFVWNAQLSKSILRGSLTFMLIGYDILGQLSNITYTVNAQGSTETWHNVIPRYGMLRVIYRFNKQPKKK